MYKTLTDLVMQEKHITLFRINVIENKQMEWPQLDYFIQINLPLGELKIQITNQH